MSYDVFISYSHVNKQVADAFCHYLEEQKIRCWIAPRDIPPGGSYAAYIDDGIKNSQICVIIFSEHSADSKWCCREMDTAVNLEKIVIPFRIDTHPLEKSMRTYLGSCHWIDAFPDPESLFASTAQAIAKQLNKSPETELEPASVPQTAPVSESNRHRFLGFLRLFIPGVLAALLPWLPLICRKALPCLWFMLPVSLIGAYFLRYNNLQGLAETGGMIRRLEIRKMLLGFLKLLFCANIFAVFGMLFLTTALCPLIIIICILAKSPAEVLHAQLISWIMCTAFCIPALGVYKVGKAIWFGDYEPLRPTKQSVIKWLVLSLVAILLFAGGIVTISKSKKNNPRLSPQKSKVVEKNNAQLPTRVGK